MCCCSAIVTTNVLRRRLCCLQYVLLCSSTQCALAVCELFHCKGASQQTCRSTVLRQCAAPRCRRTREAGAGGAAGAPLCASVRLKSVRDYTDLDTTDLLKSKQLEKFLSQPHYIWILIKNEWLPSIQNVNSVLSTYSYKFIKGITKCNCKLYIICVGNDS